MGDNVKHTNHHAEWIKAEKESAPLSGMGVSVSWIGTGGCFREFVVLWLREQPEAGVTNTQTKSVL